MKAIILGFILMAVLGCGKAPSFGEKCEIPNPQIEASTSRCGVEIHRTPSGFISDSFSGAAPTCPNTAVMQDGTYTTLSPGQLLPGESLTACCFDVKNGGTELTQARACSRTSGP